jgi:hypothetical protein
VSLEAIAVLRRLLANGRLTAMPKRPADQELVARLAAARFEPGREYREAEVNEILVAWLEHLSAPFGVDHVALRRLLVDSRLLVRTSTGSAYRLNEANSAGLEGLASIDVARVLEEIAAARAARKSRHP